MFRNLITTLARHQVKWVICGSCEGNGKVGNPSFDQGWTSSEWAEEDDDFKEGYLAGEYDIPCRDCRSSGKVLVPDMSQLTFGEKRPFAEARKEARERAEWERISAAERRMGA